MRELEREIAMVKSGAEAGDALMLVMEELKDLRKRVAQLERQSSPNQHRPARIETPVEPTRDYGGWHARMNRNGGR